MSRCCDLRCSILANRWANIPSSSARRSSLCRAVYSVDDSWSTSAAASLSSACGRLSSPDKRPPLNFWRKAATLSCISDSRVPTAASFSSTLRATSSCWSATVPWASSTRCSSWRKWLSTAPVISRCLSSMRSCISWTLLLTCPRRSSEVLSISSLILWMSLSTSSSLSLTSGRWPSTVSSMLSWASSSRSSTASTMSSTLSIYLL
mmetsp:Transcript_16577/g.46271  ORF Transcript_16577/g.46271 Transcript_16577/m.46271 type:complete len:206 (+) Transcript_16577:1853-2470(+)